MTRGITRWSVVPVILLLVGPAALAQTASTAPQPVPWAQGVRFRMDCGQDLRRFCYGVQPGEGRLIQCLSSHSSQLSPACISRLAARPTFGVVAPSQSLQSPGLPSANPPTGAAVTASALRASCGPDVQALCGGVPRNNGGVVNCLSSHRTELSPTCDAFFKEMPVRRAAQKGVPKTTPPTADAPAATPAVNGPADTAAPSAVNGPADTAAPSAVNGPTHTTAPSVANGTAAMPATASSPTDTTAPAAANGSTDIAAPSAANGSAATAEAPPPAVNGPATTGALPAANPATATGAAPAAKSRPARGALDFPL
jgi:hypothetical protein